MPEVLLPIEFTYSCGHRGIMQGSATTQEHVDFMTEHARCRSCREPTDIERQLESSPITPLQFNLEGIIETEDDDLPALSAGSDFEVTHLHCADCDGLFSIEDLALQIDDRRTCSACSDAAIQAAENKRELEIKGQERLF